MNTVTFEKRSNYAACTFDNQSQCGHTSCNQTNVGYIMTALNEHQVFSYRNNIS